MRLPEPRLSQRGVGHFRVEQVQPRLPQGGDALFHRRIKVEHRPARGKTDPAPLHNLQAGPLRQGHAARRHPQGGQGGGKTRMLLQRIGAAFHALVKTSDT